MKLMGRKRKRIFLVLTITVISFLFLALLTLALLYFDKPLTKRILLKWMAAQADYAFEAEGLDYRLFPLTIRAAGVRIFSKDKENVFSLEADEILAKGRLGRILKNKRPIFYSVIVHKPSLYFVAGGGGKEKKEAGIASAAHLLKLFNRLEMRDSLGSLVFPQFRTDFAMANISVAALGKPGEFSYSLGSEQAEAYFQASGRRLSGSFRCSGVVSFTDPPTIAGEWMFSSLRMADKHIDVSLQNEMTVKFRCLYRPDKKELHFPEFKVFLPSLFQASGPLEIQTGKYGAAVWRGEVTVFDLAEVSEFVRPYIPGSLGAVRIAGSASAEGEWRYKKDLQSELRIRLDASLPSVPIEFSTPRLSWRANLSGRFRVEGTIPDVQVAGRLRFSNGFLRSKGVQAKSVMIDLPLAGSRSFMNFSGFQGKARALSLTAAGKQVNLSDIHLKGRGNFNVSEKAFVLDALDGKSAELPSFRAQARACLGPEGGNFLRFESSDADIKNVLALLAPFLPEEVAAWEPAGNLEVNALLEQQREKKTAWAFRGDLKTAAVNFHHPTFLLAAEGLAPQISFSGTYAPADKFLSFSLTLDLAKGETLWKEFYRDWRAHPLSGELQGRYDLPSRELFLHAAKFSLSPFGQAQASGRLRGGKPLCFDFELAAQLEDLTSLYSFLSLRHVSTEAFSFSGSWSGRVRLSRREGPLLLTGGVDVKNGAVERKAPPLFIGGLEAHFPFQVLLGETGDKEPPGALPRQGYIELGELKTPFFSAASVRLEFFSGLNRWQVAPLSFDLWEGKASVGTTCLAFDPAVRKIAAVSSLSLKQGRLAALPLAKKGFNLSGHISADLPSVDLNLGRIVAAGNVALSLFSGEVKVGDIKIEKPFSKGRVVSCSASFRDMSLEKITGTLPFGRVTGIIGGEIEDLAFSYGQPERFRLRLESARVKGVRQTFSLRAVDSLTVLSSGQDSLPSQSFLLRFVPEFPYEKIGIICSLKNDVFILRGMMREDGREYLVKKSGLAGINIINRDPQRRISFKDMVGRLKRIGASGK